MPQLIFLHQKWLGGAQNLIIWLKMCIHKLGWTFQTENHDDVDLHKLKLCKIQILIIKKCINFLIDTQIVASIGSNMNEP